MEAKRLREFANQAHILELQRGSAAGGEVAPHHAVAVQIEDAAFRKSAEQRLAHPRRIEAREFREPQRLRDGIDRLRDDELIGQLRHLSRSPRDRDA